ncbi:Lipoprotein releasing system transmembrane protein LolC [Myxococcus hansupus]|uniref:Lipoprotein releasing system transmembrane protein LolC n=1 Tax=Pseudomyxococcus hansupus TaxID=1297742 RepID=A0A0H4WLI0_9BACT|nr:FtsX-like permease family protein [Myxococcus hansupus]AKQ63574.1 Lipoprotein releasing system transmembrane protein LolC [Myxococcus hansupus]
MNYFSIGFRNILKNRRRSLVTLLSVGIGFASISLFAGYIQYVYGGLAKQAIHGELLGHLTVMKRGLRTEGRLHPAKYMFTKEELERVTPILRQYPHTRLVTPRMSLSGMVSNGTASTVFVGEGMVPEDVKKLQGGFERKLSGDLKADNPIGVATAQDLGRILNLKPGDSAALLVSTVTGQANALDVDIVDDFNTGNVGTNDKFLYLPFDLAKSLYDFDGAERLIVLLDDKSFTEQARTQLTAQLQQAGFDVELKTWLELSSFYAQVKRLFDMIFAFIFSNVFIVVVMSIVNAMSMTVVERTREIGTLRAMGLRRSGILRLFTTEAFMLVVLGCAGGLLLTLLVRFAVNGAGITYTPPNSSNVVSLMVDLDIPRMARTFVMLSVLGIGAAWFPARAAARKLVIDSLGHA